MSHKNNFMFFFFNMKNSHTRGCNILKDILSGEWNHSLSSTQRFVQNPTRSRFN